jgi:hypothetical protein
MISVYVFLLRLNNSRVRALDSEVDKKYLTSIWGIKEILKQKNNQQGKKRLPVA